MIEPFPFSVYFTQIFLLFWPIIFSCLLWYLSWYQNQIWFFGTNIGYRFTFAKIRFNFEIWKTESRSWIFQNWFWIDEINCCRFGCQWRGQISRTRRGTENCWGQNFFWLIWNCCTDIFKSNIFADFKGCTFLAFWRSLLFGCPKRPKSMTVAENRTCTFIRMNTYDRQSGHLVGHPHHKANNAIVVTNKAQIETETAIIIFSFIFDIVFWAIYYGILHIFIIWCL